jgi:hypothetical protein
VSYEAKNDLAPSYGKNSTLRRGNVGGMHRAYSAGASRPLVWPSDC